MAKKSLQSPIVALVGDPDSIAHAVSAAAKRAGGEVLCTYGEIRIAAEPKMQIGVICARVKEALVTIPPASA